MKKVHSFVKEIGKIMIIVAIATASVWGLAHAGSLTPSSSPAATMYTLSDIYNRLSTGASAGSHTLSTTTSPASSMHTLTEIYNLIPTSFAAPLKTGQAHCYGLSNDGSFDVEISCSGTGQDGELQKGVAMSYTDNNNGTITDNATGLMWQKCQPSRSGSDCSTGSGDVYSFDDGNGDLGAGHAPALEYCNALSLGSQSDWRLPNIRELLSIIAYDQFSPSINSTYFPNTEIGSYWSSTPNTSANNYAWTVTFDIGKAELDTLNATHYVRCVRG